MSCYTSVRHSTSSVPDDCNVAVVRTSAVVARTAVDGTVEPAAAGTAADNAAVVPSADADCNDSRAAAAAERERNPNAPQLPASPATNRAAALPNGPAAALSARPGYEHTAVAAAVARYTWQSHR